MTLKGAIKTCKYQYKLKLTYDEDSQSFASFDVWKAKDQLFKEVTENNTNVNDHCCNCAN